MANLNPNLSEEQIKNIQEKHEQIRNILISYGCAEYGDCIIDEICVALDYPPTTVYYKEK